MLRAIERMKLNNEDATDFFAGAVVVAALAVEEAADFFRETMGGYTEDLTVGLFLPCVLGTF